MTADGSLGTSTSPLIATGSSSLTLITGGSDRLTITSAGDVGIGTTAPNAKLSINDAATPKLNLDVAGTERAYLSYSQATSNLRLDSDGSMTLAAGNNPAATILSNGNFGIGTTTPAFPLDVAGTVRATNSSVPFYAAGSNTSTNITNSTFNGLLVKNTSATTGNHALLQFRMRTTISRDHWEWFTALTAGAVRATSSSSRRSSRRRRRSS